MSGGTSRRRRGRWVALALLGGVGCPGTSTSPAVPRRPVATKVSPSTPCERAIFDDARARGDTLVRTAVDINAAADLLESAHAALDDATRSRLRQQSLDAIVVASPFVLGDLNSEPFRVLAAAAGAMGARLGDVSAQTTNDVSALRQAESALRSGAPTLVAALEERPGFMARCDLYPGWAAPWPPVLTAEERESRRALARRWVSTVNAVTACEVASADACRMTPCMLDCSFCPRSNLWTGRDGPEPACAREIVDGASRCVSDFLVPTSADRWQLHLLAVLAQTFRTCHPGERSLGPAESEVVRSRAERLLADIPPPLSELALAEQLRRAVAELASADGAARLVALATIETLIRTNDIEPCNHMNQTAHSLVCMWHPGGPFCHREPGLLQAQ
jgi:hypothetical protein